MAEKICGIYCIENKVNGKKYIGQSIDIDARTKKHKKTLNNKKEHNKYFQRSWNKYKEKNFNFYILEECFLEYLNEKEELWINKLNTVIPNGYNANSGGKAQTIISDYTRKQISKAGKNRIVSFETKEKIRNSLLGISFSNERKLNISKNHANVKGKNNGNFEKKPPNSSSKYYGVNKIRDYWQARTMINGKQINIQHCKSEIEAAKAYDVFIINNNIDRQLNFPEDYKGGI